MKDRATPTNGAGAYRPDVDGLRAVAVLLVVFHHVGLKPFGGGYVGVDVFFVISGYLIGGLILRDADRGEFSFARFYLRRFRRIVPALLGALVFTTVLALRFLKRAELWHFGRTELGALFSYSNVVLWQANGYFDAASRQQPLLQTWSLAVEEQFYLVFPALLLLLHRYARRSMRGLLWALTLLCFLLCVFWTARDARSAYFLAPFRAWEFLLGTLIAIGAVRSAPSQWQRELLAVAGLLAILMAALTFTPDSPFPGWRALVPCAGAAMLLLAGQGATSGAGRLLAWSPMRWMGRISYSVYLWHWPLMVFQLRADLLAADRRPVWMVQALTILLSLLAGALSWRWIEQPFRTGALRAKRPLFVINGVVFALLATFAGLMVQRTGVLPRWLPQSQAYLDDLRTASTSEQLRWGSCYVEPADLRAKFNPRLCLAPDPSRRQVLVLGDSHAAHAYWGLQQAFPGLDMGEIAISGCVPTLHHMYWQVALCADASRFTFEEFLPQHLPDEVLLIANWQPFELDDLSATVQWFAERHVKVVVVGPWIEFDRPLPMLLRLAAQEHDARMLDRHALHDRLALDAQMKQLNRDRWHATYISIFEDLCHLDPTGNGPTVEGCPLRTTDSVPILEDTDHFGGAGSLFLGQQLAAEHQLP